MSDDARKRFQRRKYNWVRAALKSKPRLPALAQGIVTLFLINNYLNDETRRAWPGKTKLAKDLGTDRRNIQRALDHLVAGGWLECVRKVAGGRTVTNAYAIPSSFADDKNEGQTAPVYENRNEGQYAPKRGSVRPETRVSRPPESEEDSDSCSENVRRGVRAASEDDSFDGPTGRQDEPAAKRGVSRRSEGRKQDRQDRPAAKRTRGQAEERKRRQKTPFPEGWRFGPAEEEAAAEIAGWDAERVRKEEFGKFKDWARDEDVRSRNWPRVWIAWCKKGLEFDQREAEQHTRKQNGSGSRRGNGRADQLNATAEAMRDIYAGLVRDAERAQEAEE